MVLSHAHGTALSARWSLQGWQQALLCAVMCPCHDVLTVLGKEGRTGKAVKSTEAVILNGRLKSHVNGVWMKCKHDKIPSLCSAGAQLSVRWIEIPGSTLLWKAIKSLKRMICMMITSREFPWCLCEQCKWLKCGLCPALQAAYRSSPSAVGWGQQRGWDHGCRCAGLHELYG